MTIIIPANSAADTAYDVDNSCRFDGTSYLHKTPTSAGNRRTWTYSLWVKRDKLGTNQRLLSCDDGSSIIDFGFADTDKMYIGFYDSSWKDTITTQVFRDTSAWMHICFAVDTTQGTSTNRMKFYVNGTQVTTFDSSAYVTQNHDTAVNNSTKQFILLYKEGTDRIYSGYAAEVCMIDGLQLAPTSFGEFDSDSPTIWKPIDVSGLTFGTNGFYLDFEDSSNLGNDAFGGTDWTATNLAAIDQATDTPTNNFATLNPLFHGTNLPTFREGNLEVEDTAQDAYQGAYSTIQVPTTGLWYWEIKNASGTDIGGSTEEGAIGGVYDSRISTISDPSRITYTTQELSKFISGGEANLDDGEIAGILVDRDNAQMKIYVDDSLYTTISSVTAEPIFPFGLVLANSGTCKLQFNFGNPIHSISSGNTDPGGYGNFEFSTKSGYALCTKNLNN